MCNVVSGMIYIVGSEFAKRFVSNVQIINIASNGVNNVLNNIRYHNASHIVNDIVNSIANVFLKPFS